MKKSIIHPTLLSKNATARVVGACILYTTVVGLLGIISSSEEIGKVSGRLVRHFVYLVRPTFCSCGSTDLAGLSTVEAGW